MWWLGSRHAHFHRRLQQWIAPVQLAGYSTHAYQFGDVRFDVVVGRPCSMGSGDANNVAANGDFRKRLNFPRMLHEVYGVSDLAQSAQRLKQCVDEAQTGRIIFLAHNGPTGLGAAPDDLWGRDFGRDASGDWGDEDLRAAIDYAQDQGKQVDLVVAGHMHLLTKQGDERPWLQRVDGVTYVNAARVPRVRRAGRHHVRVEVNGTSVSVEERFV
jgi:uncharacterized protein (TIGR04168 family)